MSRLRAIDPDGVTVGLLGGLQTEDVASAVVACIYAPVLQVLLALHRSGDIRLSYRRKRGRPMGGRA